MAAALSDALNRSGFLHARREARRAHDPETSFRRATEQVLVTALERLGFEPEVVYVRDPEVDPAERGTDPSNSILLHGSSGLTHLLFITPATPWTRPPRDTSCARNSGAGIRSRG